LQPATDALLRLERIPCCGQSTVDWPGRGANADAAIEMAALEYKSDIKKLIALRRWEVAL
jgi:hypothetical protein